MVAQLAAERASGARLLDGSGPFLRNERETRLVARTLPVHEASGGELRITLPPFSLAVLQPGKEFR